MSFGMGCCCLQVTFQAANITESRHLYDQLASFTPIMLALTAASPYLRGWLTEEDTRWNVVAQSVDDRSKAERGDQPVTLDCRDPRKAGDGVNFLRKSRFGSINSYLCNCKRGSDPSMSAAYNNDLAMETNKSHEERLRRSGIDDVLAKHIAGLFVRDPLVIFAERVELDDRVYNDHWENLQSTNWQSVRWKPPHPDRGVLDVTSEDHVGWRVEFRTMEIQMTDFENAAFTVFVVLMSRVLNALQLNTYIPISKLEENMRVACKRGAVLKEKFWVRTDLFPPYFCDDPKKPSAELAQFSIVDILLGTDNDAPASLKRRSSCRIDDHRCATDPTSPQHTTDPVTPARGQSFVGFIPLMNTYLEFVGIDSVNRCRIDRYLKFIVGRATGEIKTGAQWIRDFITNHPSYKNDSRISSDIAYDLTVAIREIGEGIREAHELIGKDVKIPQCKPASNPLKNTAKDCLVQRYMARAHDTKQDEIRKQLAEKKLQAAQVLDELRELEEAAFQVEREKAGSSGEA